MHAWQLSPEVRRNFHGMHCQITHVYCQNAWPLKNARHNPCSKKFHDTYGLFWSTLPLQVVILSTGALSKNCSHWEYFGLFLFRVACYCATWVVGREEESGVLWQVTQKDGSGGNDWAAFCYFGVHSNLFPLSMVWYLIFFSFLFFFLPFFKLFLVKWIVELLSTSGTD